MNTRTALLPLVAAALIVGACGTERPGDDDRTLPPLDDGSTSTDQQAPDDAVAPDGSWRAISGALDGTDVALVAGWDLTLDISGDRIGGTAACNGYGGTAAIGTDSFVAGELSWTEMGCEPEVMDLEQAYLGSLMGIDSWSLSDGALLLTGGGAEWVFERLEPVPTADLVGTTWVLDTYIDGDAATNVAAMDATSLVLHADGTLSGSTGCRLLEGEWTANGADVLFTAFAAIDDPTVGACAPQSEEVDGWMVAVLGDGFTVDIEGERLTVLAAGFQGLSFRSVE